MPIGIQRLNAQQPQPSSQIIFIKPLPGPSQKYAQDFLERIAAVCHPIMKANHLSIMTLEEHEPNPEFIGRNFNAGEIIQLVLKAPYTGHWLSFRSVQMVMMHELAHCEQMNHSGAFWKVNNQFKAELRNLWSRGYTGDGLWGKGQTVLSGEYHSGTSMEDEVLPANLCGGTFRTSRRWKRKRGGEKSKETYAERRQRRIREKFGVNGQSLGDDIGIRVKLEDGKKAKGKPRVAGSARGRELRAAAALARFEQVKEEETKKEDESLFGDSDSESDHDSAEDGLEATEKDGSRMYDGKGRGFIKVCGNEDQDDAHVKREIAELQSLNNTMSSPISRPRPQRPNQQTSGHSVHAPEGSNHRQSTSFAHDNPDINLYDIPQYVEPSTVQASSKPKINIHPMSRKTGNQLAAQAPLCDGPLPTNALSNAQSMNDYDHQLASNQTQDPARRVPDSQLRLGNQDSTDASVDRPALPCDDITCPVCSMNNEPSALLCIVCSHVLDTKKVTQYWLCPSEACKGSQYINAADCGLCGICGLQKPV